MENFAKLLLDVLVIGVVVRRGNALTNRAYEHLREPTKNLWSLRYSMQRISPTRVKQPDNRR
jgi:hypothetical protein